MSIRLFTNFKLLFSCHCNAFGHLLPRTDLYCSRSSCGWWPHVSVPTKHYEKGTFLMKTKIRWKHSFEIRICFVQLFSSFKAFEILIFLENLFVKLFHFET